MNKYELLYIISSDASEEQREELIKKFASYIESKGGSVDGMDKWGMRKLAYPIKKEINGYYYVMNIEASVAAIKEIDRRFSLDESILRHLIIKLDEE